MNAYTTRHSKSSCLTILRSVLGSNLPVGDVQVFTGTMEIQTVARDEPGHLPSDE